MTGKGTGEMGKKLSEMSLEELWELFPIVLTEHQEVWKSWYEAEEKRLREILGPKGLKRISHIGSTAVPSIWAKPIIDMLAEIDRGVRMEEVRGALENCGYLCMSESSGRMSFNRGYTEKGFAEQVFHLHLRYEGDNREIIFREYLTENPETAKEYERLKLELWERFRCDRDGYTEAKTDFVEKYTKLAEQKRKQLL